MTAQRHGSGYGPQVPVGPRRTRQPRTPHTKASPVKITRADGTTIIEPALTPGELRRLIRRTEPAIGTDRSRPRLADPDPCLHCHTGHSARQPCPNGDAPAT